MISAILAIVKNFNQTRKHLPNVLELINSNTCLKSTESVLSCRLYWSQGVSFGAQPYIHNHSLDDVCLSSFYGPAALSLILLPNGTYRSLNESKKIQPYRKVSLPSFNCCADNKLHCVYFTRSELHDLGHTLVVECYPNDWDNFAGKK